LIEVALLREKNEKIELISEFICDKLIDEFEKGFIIILLFLKVLII
jgi:hypothetical protein